jgi:hypothetical protein
MPVRVSVPGGMHVPRELAIQSPDWWRGHILTDLFFVAKVILAYEKKIEYRDMNLVHKDLCDFLDFKRNPHEQKLALMFRDGLKSSIARALKIQWFIRACANKTEAKGFYYSGVFELAQDQLGRIIKELTENLLIQAFFEGIVPRDKSDFEVCAVDTGKIRFQRVEIDIGSPEKPLGGHHYTIGINDNLVNEKNSRSDTMRRKINEEWRKQESILSEHAQEYVFETTWYPDDLAGIILHPEGKFDFSALYRKACLRFIAESGYAVWSCPARGENGRPVFPAKVDNEYLDRKLKKQGSHIYNALYELQPTAAEDLIIRPEWKQNYVSLPETFVRNIACDAAGTKGKESSYSAVSIGDWDPEGTLYIPYAEKKKVSTMELYAWLMKLIDMSAEEKRPVSILGIESEKFGIALGSLMEFNRDPIKRNFILCLLQIRGRPRHVRLGSLDVLYESGHVRSKRGLTDYETELRNCSRKSQSGVDIMDTIFWHTEMKYLPKKKTLPLVAEVPKDDFEEQIRRDRLSGSQPSFAEMF